MVIDVIKQRLRKERDSSDLDYKIRETLKKNKVSHSSQIIKALKGQLILCMI